MVYAQQFVQSCFQAITFERIRVRPISSHASDPPIEPSKNGSRTKFGHPTQSSSNFGAEKIQDWKKIWYLDKMWNVSSNRVFLEKKNAHSG